MGFKRLLLVIASHPCIVQKKQFYEGSLQKLSGGGGVGERQEQGVQRQEAQYSLASSRSSGFVWSTRCWGEGAGKKKERKKALQARGGDKLDPRGVSSGGLSVMALRHQSLLYRRKTRPPGRQATGHH